MNILVLFTIVKMWKQTKHSLTEEWIKRMWYIYSGILQNVKNNKIMPFAATWKDLEIITLSEVRQRKTTTI